MRKKISFIKLIRLWGVIFLTALVAVIIGIDLFTNYHDFNIRIDKMRTDYVEQQKQMSKREVERVVSMINNERRQSEALTKKETKSKVSEAYSIVQNIYEQNKALKSEAEIQKMIVDALKPIQFNDTNGYYFIRSLTGENILDSAHLSDESQNLFNLQDVRGEYVVKKELELLREKEEGFLISYWPKPDRDSTKDFKKITFVKIFKPYNWSIGTGLSVDDIEEQIKAEWMERINNIRFGTNSNGYLFAGSWAGISLAHGAQPDLIGTDILNFEDSRGNKTSQLLIAVSKIKGGGFVPFWWRKPDTGEESSKITYAKGIPDWEMLIAAGVYFEDIEQDIIILRAALNAQTKTKVLISIIIVAMAFALLFILFNLLSNRLRKDLNLFASFFDQAAFSDKKIDREAVQYVELDQMAEYANKMLQDKVNAQQDLLDERNHLEEDVRQRTLDLTATNKELEAFSYSVSHDLRAPLRSMDGFSVALLEDYSDKLDDQGKDYLQRVRKASKKMAQLIEGILELSRTTRGEIKQESVNLSVLVKTATAELHKLQPERLVEVIIQPDLFVNGDDQLLRVTMENLLGNAWKFTGGCDKGKIEFGALPPSEAKESRPAGNPTYFVRDNGAGFDMTYADKLFGVFQRLHKTNEFPGTGIGLATVERIIHRHGGRIWAEAEVDEGATFYFTLGPSRYLEQRTEK